MMKLTADVLDKLGGGNLRRYRVLPSVWPSGLRGYEAHLQMLQILLRLHMYGEISQKMADRVHEHYHRNPKNVVFSIGYHLITDGDMNGPAGCLLHFDQYPPAQLPTNLHRSEEYLYQREMGFDWWPSDKEETFSGSDLIFAVGLIEKFLGR